MVYSDGDGLHQRLLRIVVVPETFSASIRLLKFIAHPHSAAFPTDTFLEKSIGKELFRVSLNNQAK